MVENAESQTNARYAATLNTLVVGRHAGCGAFGSEQSHVKGQATLHRTEHMTRVEDPLLVGTQEFGVVEGSLLVRCGRRFGG